jgi:hypothetical protein
MKEKECLMELSGKEIGGLVCWGISLGGTIAWVKLKIKGNSETNIKHDDRIKKLEDDNARLAKLEEHDARLTRVEGRFFTENDEPALLSYRAHNHICDGKTKIITQELQHVVEAINKYSQTMKEHSDQVAGLTIAVAVLEEKMENKQ